MIEYSPNFRSVKENGIFLIRSNMVLIKNQGNTTVTIDFKCELPPNAVLEYAMSRKNSMCVWDMQVQFSDTHFAQFTGDDLKRNNLIIGESRIIGRDYSNYVEKA